MVSGLTRSHPCCIWIMDVAMVSGCRTSICFAVGRVQQPVQPVVGELVAADGAFIPCLLGHAADAAVVPGSAVTGIVVQVLCELRSTDTRQPATDIIGIRQLVGGTSVQGL